MTHPKPNHEPSHAPTLQDVLVAIGEINHRIDAMGRHVKRIDQGQDDLIKAVEDVASDVRDLSLDYDDAEITDLTDDDEDAR